MPDEVVRQLGQSGAGDGPVGERLRVAHTLPHRMVCVLRAQEARIGLGLRVPVEVAEAMLTRWQVVGGALALRVEGVARAGHEPREGAPRSVGQLAQRLQ